MKRWGNHADTPVKRSPEKRRNRSLLQTYLISLMSLCLSVCMLLGTTMAWFTSGVEVTQNEIYVGTLDVDLLLDGKSLKHKEGEEQVKVFDSSIIWCPDHVEVRTLTVVDEGEIPFTYKLGLSAGKDDEGTDLDMDRGQKQITDEEALRNFRSQFQVYAKVGEADAETSSQDLIEANGWVLIGTLQEIYENEWPICTGESEKMEVFEKDGEEQRRAVCSIAVRMIAEPVFTEQSYTANDFQGYTLNFNIKLVANQLGAPETVKDEAQLAAMLEAGRNVTLAEDMDGTELTAPILLKNGVLNGNDISLSVPKDTGYDCGIATTGGTIRNLTIQGDSNGSRAIGSGSSGTIKLTQNLYIDNVKIDYVQYAINGNGNGNCKVVVTNSEIYGWLSYAGLTSFDFVNCTIGEENSYDGYMVVYGNTSFTDCTFVNFDMCAADTMAENTTLSFTNCTNDGTKVTAENFRSLFLAPGDETDFNKLKNCTIMVDGVPVDTSGWTGAN